MTRIFLADSKREERSVLRLLLLDLKMEVVSEATDWSTTLTQAPASYLDMFWWNGIYSPMGNVQPWMNSERLARLRWLLFSSATWILVSKLLSQLAPICLSVEENSLNASQNSFGLAQHVFLLNNFSQDYANYWHIC